VPCAHQATLLYLHSGREMLTPSNLKPRRAWHYWKSFPGKHPKLKVSLGVASQVYLRCPQKASKHKPHGRLETPEACITKSTRIGLVL